MKELKIDKKLAELITKYLHPNQIKHLAMHKSDYQKFLVIDKDFVKIVVKHLDEETGKLVEMYDVVSPELNGILKEPGINESN